MRPNPVIQPVRVFALSAEGLLGGTGANLYSLIETAKANGLEPHAYLTHVFNALPTATSLEHFEALLPWNVKAKLNPSR